MNQRCFACLLLALGLSQSLATIAQAAKPWELLIPFKRVEADREKDYQLTDDNGPWMILAATFAGPGAEKQARQLVYELRKGFNVEAYIHEESYDFTKPVVGLGRNRYGGPKVMRYANAAKFDELAVLVGNFQGVNDPAIEKMLEKIKYAHPDCLDISKNNSTTQRFIGLRELQRRLSPDRDRQEQGPMRNAFVTRNPLLPQEYFVPQGIDPLVERMNREVEHSLLDNPGRYTVRVASFRGASTMKLEEIEHQGKRLPSKLEDAAMKAHELTAALRKKGVEAYEFHDRYESVVTVGSFDSVGRELPDGKLDLDPRIFQVMKQYEAERKQLPGQTSIGLVPRELNGIAFDVQPMPIEVPQRSIAAAYASGNRLYE
ncbi:MAG: hypothetical protein JJ992_16830 [Planctomycetes bacterium]|nr:hypothetical protein [Planctomycetota bacterium]